MPLLFFASGVPFAGGVDRHARGEIAAPKPAVLAGFSIAAWAGARGRARGVARRALRRDRLSR
jgi:hypothetical protein